MTQAPAGSGGAVRNPVFARLLVRLRKSEPPEQVEYRRELLSGLSGRVVDLGAGDGDGAIDITLKEGTTGGEFCKGVATYHENPHHLATINGCLLHHQVTSGHTFTATSRYDNSQPYQDVMGIMLTYVWRGTQ